MDRLPPFGHVCPMEPKVHTILKERFGERVHALKISQRRAYVEAGLEAEFIQDIITGRPNTEVMMRWQAWLPCSNKVRHI